MGDEIQEIVRTKRFELVNDKGEKRAEIGFEGTELALTMHAPNGEPRVKIAIDNLGAAHISFCHGDYTTPIASINESGYIHTTEYKGFRNGG
jgi:hypothetical protein